MHAKPLLRQRRALAPKQPVRRDASSYSRESEGGADGVDWLDLYGQ